MPRWRQAKLLINFNQSISILRKRRVIIDFNRNCNVLIHFSLSLIELKCFITKWRFISVVINKYKSDNKRQIIMLLWWSLWVDYSSLYNGWKGTNFRVLIHNGIKKITMYSHRKIQKCLKTLCSLQSCLTTE